MPLSGTAEILTKIGHSGVWFSSRPVTSKNREFCVPATRVHQYDPFLSLGTRMATPSLHDAPLLS
jgi:hypothetical protein